MQGDKWKGRGGGKLKGKNSFASGRDEEGGKQGEGVHSRRVIDISKQRSGIGKQRERRIGFVRERVRRAAVRV